jgi:hypothetical protein
MSAPPTTVIVHRAAPVVSTARSQWCADCGAVVLRSLATRPAWPVGALIGIRERRPYVVTLDGSHPLTDNERRCRS